MTTANDRIPIVATYRGVGIHDQQNAARIAAVQADIDAVHDLTDVGALFDFAGDVTRAPEARLFSAAKCNAIFELAIDERRQRPDLDRDRLAARVAGLNCQKWRDPVNFGSLLDTRPKPGGVQPVRRERELRSPRGGGSESP